MFLLMKKGNEVLNSIWDCRDDEEGIYYDLEESSKERKIMFKKKFTYIDGEKKKRKLLRITALGFWEEPIEDANSEFETISSTRLGGVE